MSDNGRTDSEQARYDQAQRRFQEGVAQRAAAIEADKPNFRTRPRLTRVATELRCYQGEVDWVIAKTLDDALAVLHEHYGDPYHKVIGITEQEAREELAAPVDPDTPLTIWTERSDWEFQAPSKGEVHATQWPIVWRYDPMDDDDDYFMVKQCAPVWWWIQTQGRGFLCSSEY